MKAKVVKTTVEVAPEYVSGREDLIDFREVFRNGGMVTRPFWKHGAVIECPDAFMAVRLGWAIPADEGCALRANRNPEQQAEAQKAYERVSRGIHPDDYDLFDAGIIEGYDAKGEFIPGKNWHLMEGRRKAAEQELEDEDDDE